MRALNSPAMADKLAVADSYLWRTVQDSLPPLIADVLAEIALLDADA